MAGAASGVPVNPGARFSATIGTVTPGPFAVGTSVQLVVMSTSAGYGHVYVTNASGQVTVYGENVPLQANQGRLVPGPQDGFRIQATAPAGTSTAILVVTRQPFQGLASQSGAPMLTPFTLQQGGEQFATDLTSVFSRLPPDEWVIATHDLRVI